MQGSIVPNGAPTYLPPGSSGGPSPPQMPFPLPGSMPPRPHSGHQQQQHAYPYYGPNGANMPPSASYYAVQQQQHQHQQRKQNNMYQGGGDMYSYGNLGQSFGGNGPYFPPAPNYGPGPSYPGYMAPPPPQMGGPGPATLQNAAPWNYQDGYAPRQPLHPGHPGENYGQPHPHPMMNGHDNVDHSFFGPPPPPSEGHYNHPQQPPPHFDHQGGQYPGGAFPPQHQQQHPHQPQHGPNHQQHQHQPPYFPPGHPYANGGGFGYQSMAPLHQQPGFPYVTGPPLQPGQFPPAAPAVGSTPQRQPNKSLNPAARGFEFKPAAAPFRPSGASNGNTQSSQPIHEPTFPSLTPAAAIKPEQPPFADQSNVESNTLATGVQGNNSESTASGGGLGLSQMDRAVTPPRPTTGSVPMTSRTDTTDTTPGMTRSDTSHDLADVETPRGNTERGQSTSPPPADSPAPVAPVENASDLKFVGPTVEGYVSPAVQQPELPSVQAPASVVQSDQDNVVPATIPAPSKASTVKPAPGTPVTEWKLLNVAPHTPAHDSTSKNSYKASIIPEHAGITTRVVKTSVSGSSRTENKAVEGRLGKPIMSMGNGNDTPMKIAFPDMVFGGLSSADIPAIVIRSEPQPTQEPTAQKSEAEVDEKTEDATTPAALASAPAPAPAVAKPKPSSWAALLGGGKAKAAAAPSETASMGPSSIRVSPSKSTISLMTETDAQHSNPVTPKSVAPSLPPPSTGVSATKGPRPSFNYAAAAAAGKNISPENELVKLLTEGLKAKSQKPALQANVPRGLVNTGNMCFANTILQMLVYCAPFAELFDEFGRRLKPDLSRRTPLIESLIVFLHEFQPGAVSGSSTPASEKPNGNVKGKGKEKRYTANDPFIPENVYDAMKENKRFDSLRRGHQEDAEEFLGFFLETLHEEVLHLVSRTESSSKSTSAPRAESNGDANEIQRPVSPTDGWLEVGKKQKTNVVRNTETRDSAVSRIFGGSLRSVLHTPGQKDSVTLEPYQPLQLDIQSSTVRSITDALRQLNEPEVVPGVWSAARNCNVDATKQVYIETFPPVLILHLKRFVYDPLARDVVKKSKPVAYASELIVPQEIFSPARRSASDVKYRLFAVDYHHGSSASGGHYTIAVARQDAKGWIHFDDETHSTLAEEDVVVSQEEAEKGKPGLVGGREKCAYLLFYQRVR